MDRSVAPSLRWAHGLAWALWATTFPLIWMGGFVTTYDAGMAVPDWPNTYGYNLFLYPIESWLKTWDIFLEHSHRLIAAAAGFLAIGMMIALWKTRRKGLRHLGLAIFVMICVQGVLGGLRVLGQEILLANLHGCIAPLFFGLVTVAVVITSPQWLEGADKRQTHAAWTAATWYNIALPIVVYLQIVLGAQLRHLPPELSPYLTFFWTILHLVVAGLIAVVLISAWRNVVRQNQSRRWLKVFTTIYLCQIILGLCTWVVNYNFPVWFFDYFFVVPYTITKGGAAQAVVTTAHAATGSLLLATAVAGGLFSGIEMGTSVKHTLVRSEALRTRAVRDARAKS